MNKLIALIAAAALTLPGAVGSAPAASAAPSIDGTYLAKSGGRTHCLYVGPAGSNREVMYYRSGGKRLMWEGRKGTGWQNGHSLRSVVRVDKDGFEYPDVARGVKTRLRLSGTNTARVVSYQKAGAAKVTSPAMRKVSFTRYANANCPQEMY